MLLSPGLGWAARRHAFFAPEGVVGILVLAIAIDEERRYDRTLAPFDRRVARSRALACRFDISLGTTRASASSVRTGTSGSSPCTACPRTPRPVARGDPPAIAVVGAMEPQSYAASTQRQMIREIEAMDPPSSSP